MWRWMGKPHGLVRCLAALAGVQALSAFLYFPRFWEACRENLNITQMGAAELRHAALLARRRARPARRRRELVAQLRRRSRDVLELPDPGPVLRSSLENGGGGGTEECRRAAGLVVRSKRTVGQRAEPRRRARWSAYDSPMMPSH